MKRKILYKGYIYLAQDANLTLNGKTWALFYKNECSYFLNEA